MHPDIALTYTIPALETECQQLAKALSLPMTSLESTHYAFLLVLTGTHLELRDLTEPKLKPLRVDFLSNKLNYRQKHGGRRKQLIARAIGIKPKITLRVLDLTAGMGEDAFVLATLGCHVTMVERDPIIAALLNDGLQRLHTEQPHFTLELVQTSSIDYLQQLKEKPDIIYLDPMFPDTQRTALAKKEMRILRKIVGDDLDAEILLKLALSRAKKRVVVKRSRFAPTLGTQTPSVIFSGKSNRFDVYLFN